VGLPCFGMRGYHKSEWGVTMVRYIQFKPITTYYARHSFATILKNSGVSTEFICEALGHTSLQTTKNYLAGFEQDAIRKTTDVLTSFKNNLKIA
jgi:integrase